MKIGVISDTHLTEPDERLEKLLDKLEGVDLLVHLGDIVSRRVLEFMKERLNVEAVLGNMDHPELSGTLKKKLVLELEGARIGLTHGWGPPDGIEERVLSLFREDGVDAVLFGHTHNPTNTKIKGILLFNPGSPTDRIYARENTYGILEVSGGTITGRIERFRP